MAASWDKTLVVWEGPLEFLNSPRLGNRFIALAVRACTFEKWFKIVLANMTSFNLVAAGV